METAAGTSVRVPVRWSFGRMTLRFLLYFPLALVAALIIPAPILYWDVVFYMVGFGTVLCVAIFVVARRLKSEEKKAIQRDGPFIVFENGSIRFVIDKQPVEIPIDYHTVSAWYTDSHRSGKNSFPPQAHLLLKSADRRFLLIGSSYACHMQPLPLLALEESFKRRKGTRKINVYPEDIVIGYQAIIRTLALRKIAEDEANLALARRKIIYLIRKKHPLPPPQPEVHSTPATPVPLHQPVNALALESFLADIGDPNARNAYNRTPLMVPGRSAAENRALIKAGADVNAVDGKGLNAIYFQCVANRDDPDFIALQVLLDAGITRHTRTQAEEWKALIRRGVTSALEQNIAESTCDWLDANARD